MITSTIAAPPIYVTDLCRIIKANGGSVWNTGKTDYGFYIVAELSGKQIRAVIGNGQPVPQEKNVLTHVITSLDGFRKFLNSLVSNPSPK